MKDFDLEGLSREMPYKMPEHFLDDMTERVVAQIGKLSTLYPSKYFSSIPLNAGIFTLTY